MISHDRKLLFIHVPKTGGSSITHTYIDLFERVEAGTPTHRRPWNFHVDLRTYFKFMVVRNPWAMCASWVSWHHKHNDRNKTIDMAAEHVETPTSLGMDIMDAVLKYEQLPECLDNLMESRGIEPRKLLRLNVSNHGNHRDCFTDSARTLVATRFSREIERFDYEF